MPGKSIHMLSCARMFYTEETAKDLATAYLIEAEPILTASAILFVVGTKRAFEGIWMDVRDGYHFMRGEYVEGRMLYTPSCKMGAQQAEREEAI